MNRLRQLLILALTNALLAPTAAGAATIELDQGGPEEPIFIYRADAGERNRLTVTAGKTGLTFVDSGARRIRARGDDDGLCRYRGNRAVCNRLNMIIRLGGGNDSVRFKGSIASGHGPRSRTEVRPERLIPQPQVVEPPQFGGQAWIEGGSGDDVLEGTRNQDVILPGSGRDRVDSGAGDDQIQVAPDHKVDTLRGGTGVDMVDVLGDTPVTIDLSRNVVGTRRDTDRLDSVENSVGSTGDDRLIGSRGHDGLSGDGGNDTVRGGGGDDYLSGDQPVRFQAAPGVDRLEGGSGNDLLDGRDATDEGRTLTPTDELACGTGKDTVIALTDDLVDECELSAFGRFQNGAFFDEVGFDNPSSLAPAARGGDGAPTYVIGCPGLPSSPGSPTSPCNGVVQLRRAPVAGQSTDTELLGTSARFRIEAGATANVAVVLNDAGRSVLAQPGARASVRVLAGRDFDPREFSRPGDFGWQQQLGR